jgi:hypothetical protein
MAKKKVKSGGFFSPDELKNSEKTDKRLAKKKAAKKEAAAKRKEEKAAFAESQPKIKRPMLRQIGKKKNKKKGKD